MGLRWPGSSAASRGVRGVRLLVFAAAVLIAVMAADDNDVCPLLAV
jgi:hypothetical protein